VALFFKRYLEENKIASSEILDLMEYDFPLFHERLRNLKEPDPKLVDFATKVKAADGIIIVFPEYNGGISASLKNVMDVLYDEWRRKPIGLASCSNFQFGGSQAIMWAQFSLWKIGAWVVPARFQAAYLDKSYTEEGVPTDTPPGGQGVIEKSASSFIRELLWCIERNH
jgi:NAD(P)H-dependent FMN reductase